MRRQLPLQFGDWQSFAPEDFLVTDSNRQAFAWVERWPEWPGPVLGIHGPPGAGKTHLAEVWCRRAGARRFTASDLAKGPDQWLDSAAGCVAVDDADCVVGSAESEQLLLHLYNQIAERRGFLVFTSCEPPMRWGLGLADLASRLNAAPAALLTPPDDDLLAVVLAKLFADKQLRVPGDVIGYLTQRMERSFVAARQIVAEIDALSLDHRRSITLSFVRKHWRPAGAEIAG